MCVCIRCKRISSAINQLLHICQIRHHTHAQRSHKHISTPTNTTAARMRPLHFQPIIPSIIVVVICVCTQNLFKPVFPLAVVFYCCFSSIFKSYQCQQYYSNSDKILLHSIIFTDENETILLIHLFVYHCFLTDLYLVLSCKCNFKFGSWCYHKTDTKLFERR